MIPRQSKFEGKCEDLKAFIYDCSDATQSYMFIQTQKDIGEYMLEGLINMVGIFGLLLRVWNYQSWQNQMIHPKLQPRPKKESGKSRLMSLSNIAAIVLKR